MALLILCERDRYFKKFDFFPIGSKYGEKQLGTDDYKTFRYFVADIDKFV
jgi:hypothetical protein